MLVVDVRSFNLERDLPGTARVSGKRHAHRAITTSTTTVVVAGGIVVAVVVAVIVVVVVEN